MAQESKKITFIIIILIFIIYFFAAARPIPRETVLAYKWASSLKTELTENDQDKDKPWSGDLIPFNLGSYFGFADSSGNFALNRIRTDDIYLSRNMWTEYGAESENITVNNILNESEIIIENAGGYPILLDNRIFILGSEQNSLSEIDNKGNVLWTYEFGAPLTAIDAASGLVVTGSLDGLVEVFNSRGERIFYFDPNGSRYSIILGCAVSRDGSRIGIISGIDQQRFLLLERLDNIGDYKVIYHEYLDTGFRRPVHILFVDNDQHIIYERMGGIGYYNIRSRRGINIPLEGEITAIDESGDNGLLFLITSHANLLKKLVGIKFSPNRFLGRLSGTAVHTVFLEASFNSADVFMKREGSMFVIGGGTTLISFDLEEK